MNRSLTPRKFFFVMTGCLCATGALLIGAAVGGNMLFQKQAKKLDDLKVQSGVIEKQEESLVQAKKDIEKYQDLDTIARTIVPQDKDQAKTVRELSAIAAESEITLKAITFPTSNLGTAQPAAPSTQPSSGESSSTAKPAVPPISQVKPISGIPGVYALEIIISTPEDQPVPYEKFLNFLQRLESNRRTAHVDKINVTPKSNGNSLSFVLTLNAYVKP